MGLEAERNHRTWEDTCEDAGDAPADRDAGPDRGRRLGFVARWMGGWPADGWPEIRWRLANSPLAAWLDAPDSYWRRRFFILAGGLVVFGLAAWGASALAGPAKPIAGTSPDAGASLSAQATLPPAAYGMPVTPTPSHPPTPSPAPSGTMAIRAPASMTPAPSGSAGGSASAGPSASSSAVPRCNPASIVLSLFTSMPAYGPHQAPTFEVDAVSTAPGSCQMPYGASTVKVVVTQAGKVMWDSSACKAPAATTMAFTQGVPVTVTIAWNRNAATKACAGSLPSGAAGTFQAVATATGNSSTPRAFTLDR